MCRSRMCLVVWLITAIVLFLAVPGLPKADEGVAKRLIVMIEGEIDGGEFFGAGIIIGTGADRLYIVTANHVLRRRGKTPEQVRVRLKFLPGQKVEAEVLADFDRDLDLAVLSVRGVKALAIPLDEIPFERLGAAEDLKRADEVFTIGNPLGRRWRVNVSPDRISENTGDRLTFESQFVAKGHSGGGLFNNDWELVGMITADQPPDGVALRIDRLIGQLKRWDYPVKLKAVPGGPPPEPVVEVPAAPVDIEAELGLTRAERRNVQRALQVLGFDPGGVDGILGPNSRLALRMWQRAAGEERTGYLTESQYTKLRAEAKPKLAEISPPSKEPSKAFLVAKAKEQVLEIFAAVQKRDVESYVKLIGVPFFDRDQLLRTKKEVGDILRQRIQNPNYPKQFSLLEVDAKVLREYKRDPLDDEFDRAVQALQLGDNDVISQVLYRFERVDKAKAVMFFRWQEGDLKYAGSCCLQTWPKKSAQPLDLGAVQRFTEQWLEAYTAQDIDYLVRNSGAPFYNGGQLIDTSNRMRQTFIDMVRGNLGHVASFLSAQEYDPDQKWHSAEALQVHRSIRLKLGDVVVCLDTTGETGEGCEVLLYLRKEQTGFKVVGVH